MSPNKRPKTNKVNASHSTVIGAAARVVDRAQRMPQVSKISLGIIIPIRGPRKAFKIQTITGGIKAIVQGGGAVQELYIYTSDPEYVEKVLEEFFYNSN